MLIDRLGKFKPFNSARIRKSINAATTTCKAQIDIDAMVLKVCEQALQTVNVHLETVQNLIIIELMQVDSQVALAYAKYRQHHAEKHKTLVDTSDTIKEYIDDRDWRIKANANQRKSLGGLILNTSGKVTANYWLDSVYTKEIGEAHRNGDFHIHDLDMLCGYCFTGDTRVPLLNGSNPTLQELSKRKGRYFVYSINSKGDKVAGVAHSARLTQQQAEIVEVKLVNGERIRCTPDHKFLISLSTSEGVQGEYKEAKNLGPKTFVWGIDFENKEQNIGFLVTEKPKVIGIADVYCLTVEEHHNFALSAGVFVHNCAGWSLRQLLLDGFNDVEGSVNAAPPRHLSSAIGQMINFLGSLQNEWAGAQAFSSFDTYLAPYVWKDRLNYNEVKQVLQTFIFCCNVPSRWGGQAVFSNITFDWTCPEDLKEQIPLIADKPLDRTYGQLQDEMDMIGEAFYEIVLEGDATGNPFTFPIPTINITEDFLWDSKKSDLLFKTVAKYGITYFQNFLTSDLKPHQVRSMCCRLQLNLDELLKRGNGLFGSVESTGSLGVVTINCARLGYTCNGDLDKLYLRLENLLILAKQSLELKRQKLNELLLSGLYPHTTRYLPRKFINHFSTIGVNGVNEMIRNYTQDRFDITSQYGEKLAVNILKFIRTMLLEFQQETGNLYNLEATPAEGTTYRFAKEDLKRFPNILQAGTADAPYYTNSTQPPVDWTNDPFDILDNQKNLQALYTGGTVIHLYTGEKLEGEFCKKLVRRIFNNYSLPYLTITTVFSVCNTCGYFAGEHYLCPSCKQAITVWSRVMGYHRPVSSYNKGKLSEHAERQLLNLAQGQ
jgi:ribonucleoside-triphosphate reductase